MFSSSAAPINVTVSEGLIWYREHNVANQGYKSRKPAVKNTTSTHFVEPGGNQRCQNPRPQRNRHIGQNHITLRLVHTGSMTLHAQSDG